MNTALTLPRPFLNLPPQSLRLLELPRVSSVALSSITSSSATSPLRLTCASANRITSRQMMSSAISQPEFTELSNESDFDEIAIPPGLISICGFGSLLSERSARSTFPNLMNFRVARLNGFRRVFAHVAPIFFERGIAKPETKEISSLSAEPCVGETLIVSVFEIEKSEIPAFMERELEFRFLAVVAETLDGKPFDAPAVLCARYSDEEFFKIRCKGSKDVYFQHYGRYNIDKIWRDDILPCRVYMRHCFGSGIAHFQNLFTPCTKNQSFPCFRSVLAAKNLSEEAYDNFLDHTFLGDRKTTIRDYLATTGAGIMEEEPPLSLRTRYGG
ncbi:hypothetical protein LINPERHAP2_LOCUS5463 [Linum perenne]